MSVSRCLNQRHNTKKPEGMAVLVHAFLTSTLYRDGDHGSTVVNVLCYKLGVDSACNRNEYQDYFLGVKAAGA